MKSFNPVSIWRTHRSPTQSILHDSISSISQNELEFLHELILNSPRVKNRLSPKFKVKQGFDVDDTCNLEIIGEELDKRNFSISEMKKKNFDILLNCISKLHKMLFVMSMKKQEIQKKHEEENKKLIKLRRQNLVLENCNEHQATQNVEKIEKELNRYCGDGIKKMKRYNDQLKNEIRNLRKGNNRIQYQIERQQEKERIRQISNQNEATRLIQENKRIRKLIDFTNQDIKNLRNQISMKRTFCKTNFKHIKDLSSCRNKKEIEFDQTIPGLKILQDEHGLNEASILSVEISGLDFEESIINHNKNVIDESRTESFISLEKEVLEIIK